MLNKGLLTLAGVLAVGFGTLTLDTKAALSSETNAQVNPVSETQLIGEVVKIIQDLGSGSWW